MAYKSILVHVDSSPESRARLQSSIELARRYQAHVIALAVGIEPDLAVFTAGGAPIDVIVEQSKTTLALTKKIANEAQAAIDRNEVKGEARWITEVFDNSGPAFARQCLYADLAVLGQAQGQEQEPLLSHLLDSVLLTSGVPVFVHPNTKEPIAKLSRIQIAWSARPECANAVRNALPLLKTAEAIQLVIVDSVIGVGEHGEEPGADIALFLARHDLDVEVLRLPGDDHSIAETLTEHAGDWPADAIVMGAYGHSRLRQVILGGVTRALLQETACPLLMSH
jgi:nucleotide-binding universal stress UspA family protein